MQDRNQHNNQDVQQEGLPSAIDLFLLEASLVTHGPSPELPSPFLAATVSPPPASRWPVQAAAFSFAPEAVSLVLQVWFVILVAFALQYVPFLLPIVSRIQISIIFPSEQ